uniref:Protein kinase domain-containing protein n=1 Tax=Xenopus tropicalis TaxID=8364 RepID=A0A803JCY2_XENTR
MICVLFCFFKRFYSSEIVVGLQFLHTNGIVHRDLKPENILLDEEGHLKIADFGLACTSVFGSKTLCGYYGTPGYIAPEVLSDEEYNAGADWWSFGVILYEMATGTLPFSLKGTSGQQVKRILDTEPKYPKSLSPELLDLLQQLLKKKANHAWGYMPISGTTHFILQLIGWKWKEDFAAPCKT